MLVHIDMDLILPTVVALKLYLTHCLLSPDDDDDDDNNGDDWFIQYHHHHIIIIIGSQQAERTKHTHTDQDLSSNDIQHVIREACRWRRRRITIDTYICSTTRISLHNKYFMIFIAFN